MTFQTLGHKSNEYESIDVNQDAKYINIPNSRDDPSDITEGNINAGYETLDVNATDADVEYYDIDTKSIENTESVTQLKLAQKETKTENVKSLAFPCKMDRKLIVIIIIGAIFLIMVAVAIAVYFSTQSGDENTGWAKWSSWGSCSVILAGTCGTGTGKTQTVYGLS